MPSSVSSSLAFYTAGAGSEVVSGLQKALSNVAHKHSLSALLNVRESSRNTETNTRTLNRFVSITAPHAGAWINTIPSQNSLILSDSHYRIGCRLRLGLNPSHHHVPSVCMCCRNNHSPNPHAADAWHFLSCKSLSVARIERHNHIVQCVRDFACRVGISVRIEPRPTLFTDDNRRPDLFFMDRGHNTLTDVVVVHPLAPSYLRHSPTHLHCAIHKEKNKIRKYEQLAQREYAKFIPFAVESTGGFGEEAQKILHQITRASLEAEESNTSVYSSREISNHLQQSVSICIMRGNAKMIEAGDAKVLELARRNVG
jgi:hypothetical protein